MVVDAQCPEYLIFEQPEQTARSQPVVWLSKKEFYLKSGKLICWGLDNKELCEVLYSNLKMSMLFNSCCQIWAAAQFPASWHVHLVENSPSTTYSKSNWKFGCFNHSLLLKILISWKYWLPKVNEHWMINTKTDLLALHLAIWIL